MENILSIIQNVLPYIVLAMIVVVIILFILVIVLWRALTKVERRYKKLMKGSENKNLEQLIVDELGKIDSAKDIADQALQTVEAIRKDMIECVQKIAVMRYKAFDDVGSDLSFSIALLDGHNDGVVLTGLYGRQDSTCFAKPIDKGISRYQLSEEEKCVLDEAIKKTL
ncbi:DUF4446 family protein [uncultured Clostridium sp.]|uniref:DUF4446 family protein n=1 Tax=uncultured Clostridium sp. TaxID=59620 RepID=UPI0026064683|nr:DUF4446 family protein [uncultured Clostridium sp.]